MDNISNTVGSSKGGLESTSDEIIAQGLLDLGRPVVRGFHELTFGSAGEGFRTIRVPKRKRGTFGKRANERAEIVGTVEQLEGVMSKNRMKQDEVKHKLSQKRARLLGSASGSDFDDNAEDGLVDQMADLRIQLIENQGSNENLGEGSLEEGDIIRDNQRAWFGGIYEDGYKITDHPLLIGASHERWYSDRCRRTYSKMCAKEILTEKRLTNDLCIQDFVLYIKDHNLWQASSAFTSYNKELTLEFYANLMKANTDASSEWYGLVYVRGVLVRFNPAVINHCLGSEVPPTCQNSAYPAGFNVSKNTLAEALSGGVIKKWGTRSTFPAALLSQKFFCLYRVVSGSWIMSSNTSRVTSEMTKLMYCIDKNLPFNLGKIIYDRIWGCLESTRGNEKLLHPSLLTAIMNHSSIRGSPLDSLLRCGSIFINGRVTNRKDDLPSHGAVEDCKEADAPALLWNLDGGKGLNLNEEPGQAEQLVRDAPAEYRLAVVDGIIGDLESQVDALQDQLRGLKEERNGLLAADAEDGAAGTTAAENGAWDGIQLDLNASCDESFTALRL